MGAVQETNGLKISLGETRHSLKRAKNKILKQSETIARLKVEYNRLFHLAEKSENRSTTITDDNGKKLNRETIRDLANKNSHYADFYKKKLADTKVEVKALKSITRRWMMSDHKKTAELRVTREATKRYAVEMT